MKKTVVCYIEKDNKYLVMLRNKKEYDINKDKYIGVGGHIEKGEDPMQACIREVKEETGLDIIPSVFCGIVYFKAEKCREKMYVFLSNNFTGELKDCDEGTLMWVDKHELLNMNIWEGDKLFLECVEKCEQFVYKFKYQNNKLVKVKRVAI